MVLLQCFYTLSNRVCILLAQHFAALNDQDVTEKLGHLQSVLKDFRWRSLNSPLYPLVSACSCFLP